jgi:hypothetical protein
MTPERQQQISQARGEGISAAWAAMTPERQQQISQARGPGISAAWAALTPERRLEINQAKGEGNRAAWAALPQGRKTAFGEAMSASLQATHGPAHSAENAARVAAGREGLEAHVLEMLQATCSAKGKWNIKAAHEAHKQQGGGMSRDSFYLAAGRLRDRQ